MKKENFNTPQWKEYFKGKSPEEIEEIKKLFEEKKEINGKPVTGLKDLFKPKKESHVKNHIKSDQFPEPERGWFEKKLNPLIKCPNCGYIGKPTSIGWDTGGCLITIILLICFIIPGIIYLIWRDSKSAQLCCPKCKYLNVIRI